MTFWSFFVVAHRLTSAAERFDLLMRAALFQRLREHIFKGAARDWAPGLPAEPSDGTHCDQHSRRAACAASPLCADRAFQLQTPHQKDEMEIKKRKKEINQTPTFLKLLSVSMNFPKHTEDSSRNHFSATDHPPEVHVEFITKVCLFTSDRLTEIISCSPQY